ncbi:MAG TPA: hypothetical protein VGQ03_03550 [Nitrososphaera sp.]|jgi:hypothetical protein|nr:hypothetical protein [Nitrososphaera sp.]
MTVLENLLLQLGGEIVAIVLAVLIGLVALWILVSIPVWIAAKILTLGRAKFTRAMLVTAVGPIVYAVVFIVSSAILSVAFGESSWLLTLALIIAFIAWIGVFKKGFDTGWLRALGIAILATVVFTIMSIVITLIIWAFVPNAPAISPIPLQQA